MTCSTVYSEPAVPLWLEADHHSVWYQHVAAGTTDKYIKKIYRWFDIVQQLSIIKKLCGLLHFALSNSPRSLSYKLCCEYTVSHLRVQKCCPSNSSRNQLSKLCWVYHTCRYQTESIKQTLLSILQVQNPTMRCITHRGVNQTNSVECSTPAGFCKLCGIKLTTESIRHNSSITKPFRNSYSKVSVK